MTRSHGCGGPGSDLEQFTGGGENHLDVEVYGAISGGENHPDVEVHGAISGGENHPDVEVHGGISGGENHPDVGRETLQEQFTKEGVGVGRCTKLVPKELLHASEEQLCWLAVAELFSTDEMLQLRLNLADNSSMMIW